MSPNLKKCFKEPQPMEEKSPEKTSITSWQREPSDLHKLYDPLTLSNPASIFISRNLTLPLILYILSLIEQEIKI